MCFGLSAQLSNVDSLKYLLKKETTDSIILRLNVQLSNECDETEIHKYAQAAIDLAQKLLQNKNLNSNYKNLFLNYLGSAYNDLGFYNRLKGNTDLALELYNKTLSIRERCRDTTGIVLVLNNIASIYYKQGKVTQALNNYNRCLSLQRSSKDKSSAALTLCNIGLVYNDQGLKEKTLSYYMQSLNISKEINDKRSMARALVNLGGVYKILGKSDSSLYFYTQCVKIEEEIGDKDFIPSALYGIASIYSSQNQTDSAIATYNKCLKIIDYLEDKQSLSYTYYALGNVYLSLKNYKKAEEYGLRSLKIAEQIGYPKDIRNAAELLYKNYKHQNNIPKALQMHELYIQMRDSINNVETKSASIKSELKYEFAKKTIADSLKNLNEQNISKTKIALQDSELKRQSILRSVLIGGIILVGLFVLFFYNRYKLTQHQKSIIEKQQQITEAQKKEIEYKSSLITQSIDYAKRIQDAFIQSEVILKEIEKEYFLLNKPKDIVSGDFLWAKKINGNLLFAVADCTGHGVPGAFMSLVSYNLLEQAVDVYNQTEPKNILDNVNVHLQKALKPAGGAKSYEGMEILLCSLDLQSNLLTFAGCKQRLLYSNNEFITEHRTDNIVMGTNTETKFNQFEIKLQKGDVLFLFTDGYPDQKGGPNKTKLYYEPFKASLNIKATEPLSAKKAFLIQEIERWRGKEEQVDDMLVFGLRV